MRCILLFVVAGIGLFSLTGSPVLADDTPAGIPLPADPPVESEPPPDGPAPTPVESAPPPAGPAPQPAPTAAPPAPVAAPQDRVRMKNGTEWVGRIVREEPDSIVLERIGRTGGTTRLRLYRKKIGNILRAATQADQPIGSTLVRDEWFLLHSDGRVVGTRNVRVSRVKTSHVDGWRLEEEILEFAQGKRLPATRIRTVEVTDANFEPVLIDFRESTENVTEPEDRYERRLSGKIERGLWSAVRVMDGPGDRRAIQIPDGVRGRLGHREYELRRPRAVGVAQHAIVDASFEGVVEIRSGFVAVEPTAKQAAGRGDEYVVERDDRRLISRFTRDHRAVREQIAEGVVALPASRSQCAVASDQGHVTSEAAPSKDVIALADGGFSFRKPGPTWKWKATLREPSNTGWRVLGRLHTPVFLADARVEWHPESFQDAAGPADVERWLLLRMRGLDASLKVVRKRAPLQKPAGAWRMDIEARLKGESIRTAVVVVDRRPGRAVILFACPTAAWAEGEAALRNFLDSFEPL